MPADFWAVVEFLGFVVAASLFVFGVSKLDLRLLAAGAVLAGVVWLGIAFTNAGKWITGELVTLRLRPIDARRQMVADAVVNAVETSEAGFLATCRLPARLESAADGGGQVLAVSLVVELRVNGSLVDEYDEPLAHTQIVDQILEITAPGYRPWRGGLKELLPGGWPTEAADSPVVVEMQAE